MTALARESGVAREALYRALSRKRKAEFATIMKVIGAPCVLGSLKHPRLSRGRPQANIDASLRRLVLPNELGAE